MRRVVVSLEEFASSSTNGDTIVDGQDFLVLCDVVYAVYDKWLLWGQYMFIQWTL